LGSILGSIESEEDEMRISEEAEGPTRTFARMTMGEIDIEDLSDEEDLTNEEDLQMRTTGNTPHL